MFTIEKKKTIIQFFFKINIHITLIENMIRVVDIELL